MPEPLLADQVTSFNEGFTAQIGPSLSAVFDQEQAALRADGVPTAAHPVGAPFPQATLVTSTGESVALADVVDGAPAVIVFYRGAWCP